MLVALAMSASSLPRVLLLILSIACLEHLFNKQGLKPGHTLPRSQETGLAVGSSPKCQEKTMTSPIHVEGFAGSLRKQSYNRALLRAALELLPEGMELEIVELDELPL